MLNFIEPWEEGYNNKKTVIVFIIATSLKEKNMNIAIIGKIGVIERLLIKILDPEKNNIIIANSLPKPGRLQPNVDYWMIQDKNGDSIQINQLMKISDTIYVVDPSLLNSSDLTDYIENVDKNDNNEHSYLEEKQFYLLGCFGTQLALEEKFNNIPYMLNELLFEQISGLNVTILRPGFYYTNFYHFIPLIMKKRIIASNFPIDTPIPLTHTDDIAEQASIEMLGNKKGKYIKYIVSDICSYRNVIEAFSQTTNNKLLHYRELSSQQCMAGLRNIGFEAHIAEVFTKMGTELRNEALLYEYYLYGSPVNGGRKIDDFAKEFADKYKKITL